MRNDYESGAYGHNMIEIREKNCSRLHLNIHIGLSWIENQQQVNFFELKLNKSILILNGNSTQPLSKCEKIVEMGKKVNFSTTQPTKPLCKSMKKATTFFY